MNDKVTLLKAGAVFLNEEGKMLLSKDRGTTKWQILGGKIEPGEAHIQTLQRELKEELDVSIDVDPKIYLASDAFSAANSPGKMVKLYYYFCKLLSEPKFIEKVEFLHWFSKDEVLNGKYEFSEATEKVLIPKLIEDKLLL